MVEKTVTAELSRNAGDETAAENEMGTLPIGKLLRKMSLPLIISMLVQVLYGLVDSMYVARLGDSALTAISLCMPVQYLAGKDIITTNYVRYTDAYVKADGKWYIKRRRTTFLITDKHGMNEQI